jgi:acetyl-CoA C-acetyltransferase
MGITAENVAEQYGISRSMMDELAATESHRRAAAAIAAGYFKEQIVPVDDRQPQGHVCFDTDEHVKATPPIETLAKMRPPSRRTAR